MKFFRASGLWFPADEPENKVAGSLRFSDTGLQLRLLGGFQGGWSPDFQEYGIIHGIVGGSPYGDFVSLYDCFQLIKSVKSQGIGTETVRCDRAYIGNDYLLAEDAAIRSISLTTSFLYEWARPKNVSSFTLSNLTLNEVGVRYIATEPIPVEIDDAVALVVSGCSRRMSARAAGLLAHSSINITPRIPLGARAIVGKFVQRLCDLLTFATDRPNAAEEVKLTRSNGMGVSKDHSVLYDRIFRLKRERSDLLEGDMLFSLSEAIEAGLNIIQRWLIFAKSNPGFCASLLRRPLRTGKVSRRKIPQCDQSVLSPMRVAV